MVFAGIIAATVLLFSAYANFFLDYSLERLEMTMDATGKSFQEVSPVSRNVYSSVLKGLTVEEAAKESVDYKNMALLEMASNSLEEATDDSGYKRAKIYLKEVLQNKLKTRPAVMRIFDRLHYHYQRFCQQVLWLVEYAKQHISGKAAVRDKTVEYSSILLLNQAEEKVRAGQTEEAAELYRKYLERYPTQPDRGFVAITLADIYTKQGKLPDAQTLLRSVEQEFGGREEAAIARTNLKKIFTIERNKALIDQLQSGIPAAQQTEGDAPAKLKLALAYLSTYQIDQAEAILKPLSSSAQPQIGDKAKFYLGWIYKLRSQYDQSITAFKELLEHAGNDQDLQLGLKTQLASTYYEKGDVKQSAETYKGIAKDVEKESAKKGIGKSEMLKESWMALAELERAKIYRYNIANAGGPENLSRRLSELDSLYEKSDLKKEQEDEADIDLRERAFYELENGRVHIALDLFEKDAQKHPRDAWTHGGLAIIFILLGDVEKGMQYAQHSYELDRDYYSASVMGYVSGLLGKYDEAINYYRESLGLNADYLPAQFNLSSIYLKIGDYQQALGILGRIERNLGEMQKMLQAKVLNNMGYAYWKLGDLPHAEEKFRQALAAVPGFTVAQSNLSLVASGKAPKMATLRE
jgi:tetratricopeptide (TPR) repeat protein